MGEMADDYSPGGRLAYEPEDKEYKKMEEKVVKDHKLKIKGVKLSDKPTKNGGKMYHVNMEHPEAGIELSAVTFSDTIAAEAEKFLDKEVDMKMSEREYNGAKSYTIVELNGVKNSGFVKGKGFQQDVVGLERRAAAEIAGQLVIRADVMRDKALDLTNLQEAWKETADYIYKWISTRPVKPTEAVTGKSDLTKPLNAEELNKIPF